MPRNRSLLIACVLSIFLAHPIATLATQSTQVISFTVPDAGWSLTLPGEGLELERQQLKPDGRHGYFLLKDNKNLMTISFFIEPATKCKSSKECRDMVLKAGNPAWEDPRNVVLGEIGDVSYFEFFMPSYQGMPLKQQHMYAQFVVDGFWVDLHISKTQYTTEERVLFVERVKSVKFEPKKKTVIDAVSQKQKVDRETKGLKGNVKSVDRQISLIDKSSGQPESTRQRGSTEEFDAAGNLTVEKHYDPFGDVLALVTYSFLDGERVMKLDIKSKRMLVLRPPVGPGQGPTRASDPRYTAKLKYKYDSNGNLIESTSVYSDGSPATKHVYTFTANEREELAYSANGSLSHKYVFKIDDKGNEVERFAIQYESPQGPVQGKTYYTYLEFDSQGNWIKRRESQGGESWIIYRTITYHK